MDVRLDEHERTLALVETALGQIRALRQPALPRNFELWYQYAAGYKPELNKSINETLAQHGTLSEARMSTISTTPSSRRTAPANASTRSCYPEKHDRPR